MNYYTHLHLDELGIASEEEAEELEYELELSFEAFTPEERRTWLQQNAYLEHFSKIGTVTSAAKTAGVTALKVQRWERYDILGFTRRLEIAALEFSDSIKEKALLRANDPNAPASLLIELLRAYIPKEFSRNGHKCDSSKSDEMLRRYREDTLREMEAGNPKIHKMAEGAENAYPPDDDLPTGANAYPDDDNYHTDMNAYPAEPVNPDDDELAIYNLSPAGEPSNSHLSPAGGETQRGGPTRAERREQLRQQRKEEKKNTFPVKRF